MIEQFNVGLNSRTEANPFDENGFLPLITAPMYSVVDESNYQIFLDNKIQVCLPRCIKPNINSDKTYWQKLWYSYSLADFIEVYIDNESKLNEVHKVVCDVANGNMPALHEAIKKAKEIHGDNLVIMAGNVFSVTAFIKLAEAGADYIRVEIGGGAGCNTTSNTGVGQEDLEELIKKCYTASTLLANVADCGESFDYDWYSRYSNSEWLKYEEGIDNIDEIDCKTIGNVKIVADGISTYIKQCETKYGFNDNGYAAINKLLYSGADLVMIGKLFAQCVESAGEKGVEDFYGVKAFADWHLERSQKNFFDSPTINTPFDYIRIIKRGLQVKYSGMSTLEEQKKYKEEPIHKYAVYKGNGVLAAYYNTQEECEISCEKTKGYFWKYLSNIKPSEGSVQWIPVRWTLNEWLNGSKNQDEYPYLMGWINSIKSAMSYRGVSTLDEFKK